MLSCNIYSEDQQPWIRIRIWWVLFSSSLKLPLVCVGFLINRLNSWLFHQYGILLFFGCLRHISPVHTHTHTHLFTCSEALFSLFVWNVVPFSHFLLQSKNNSQFSHSFILIVISFYALYRLHSCCCCCCATLFYKHTKSYIPTT